jgi:hypothetical protein
VTLDEFFSGYETSRSLFDAVHLLVDSLGLAETRVSKSQVAFAHRRAFAWAWVPGRYLKQGDVPLVLSLALDRRDDSPRWKEVVEPVPGHFMHHLELRDGSQLDDEVRAWLLEARETAERSSRRRASG